MKQVARYRSIAAASRERLSRGRRLYARLTWPTMLKSANRKLATWDMSEAAKKAGLYSRNTVTTDVTLGLAKAWFRTFGNAKYWHDRDGWQSFLEKYKLSHRVNAREAKRYREMLTLCKDCGGSGDVPSLRLGGRLPCLSCYGTGKKEAEYLDTIWGRLLICPPHLLETSGAAGYNYAAAKTSLDAFSGRPEDKEWPGDL